MHQQPPSEPFSRRDLLARGVPDHRMQEWERAGFVRRVLSGVYVPADLPDTLEVRAACAALVLAPHAVLCDRSAAWLHGVNVLRYRELDVMPPLEVYALRDHARVTRAGCVGGYRDLAPQDVIRVHGVPVTTPLRTALDLGCKLWWRDALAAVDALMRACGVTREDLRRELPRYRRRRGVVQLRHIVSIADARAESPRESWTRFAIWEAGLPMPVPQFWVVHEGIRLFRLDLAYPHARVAVEYDGEEHHTDPDARKRDEDRRRWLRDRGWTVIVLTKADFEPGAPGQWLGTLRTALRL